MSAHRTDIAVIASKCKRCNLPIELTVSAGESAWFDAHDELTCPDGEELHEPLN